MSKPSDTFLRGALTFVRGEQNSVPHCMEHRSGAMNGLSDCCSNMAPTQVRKEGSLVQPCSRLEIVNLLLDHGANADARGGQCGTAPQAASYNGSAEVVQLLVEKGADVNAKGGMLGSTIQAASAIGHVGIIEPLLDKGIGINAEGGLCGIALAAALRFGHLGALQLLHRKGADLHSRKPPKHKVSNKDEGQYDNDECEYDDDGDDNDDDDDDDGSGLYCIALVFASTGGYFEIARFLLNEGAEVDARGFYSSTALRSASLEGHCEILQLLISRGANVNGTERDGNSPIHYAATEGHYAIVKLLLQNWTEFTLYGGFYGTAMMVASYSSHSSIIQLFKKAQASPDIGIDQLLSRCTD